MRSEGGGERELSSYAITMGTSSEKPLIIGASSSSSPKEEEREQRNNLSSRFSQCGRLLINTEIEMK